jgi:hypothetical protein
MVFVVCIFLESAKFDTTTLTLIWRSRPSKDSLDTPYKKLNGGSDGGVCTLQLSRSCKVGPVDFSVHSQSIL